MFGCYGDPLIFDLGIHGVTFIACSECLKDGITKLDKKTYFYLYRYIISSLKLTLEKLKLCEVAN